MLLDCVQGLVIMSKDAALMPFFFQVELSKSGHFFYVQNPIK